MLKPETTGLRPQVTSSLKRAATSNSALHFFYFTCPVEWQSSSNVKIYYAQTWYYECSLTGVYYIVEKKGLSPDGATALTIISVLKQEVMTYDL